MVRPSTPLITRRDALRTALTIIDAEGLERFGMRRLAAELGVNAASLYHHFPNKDAILEGVVQLAMAKLSAPGSTTEDWREYALASTIEYRRVLLVHPNLGPLLFNRHPLRNATASHQEVMRFFEARGLPRAQAISMMEVLYQFAIGSALYVHAVASDGGDHRRWSSDYPDLANALDAAVPEDQATFRRVATAIIDTFAQGRGSA